MNPQSTRNPSNALEGVHGIHVVPHSPFALEEMTQHGNFSPSTCGSLTNTEEQRLLLQRMWQQRPGCLRPIKCCVTGDKHLAETVANVVTSIPFIALGLQAPRKNLNTKLYANSLVGVGVASSLYHSSRGKIRKYLRWFDYTMIAAATIVAFAKRALKDPDLRMAHNLHKMSSLLGGVLFIADDFFPSTPFIHAGWHLAAAVGVGTCNKLLE
ncbi:uncharacterized protein LOC110602184 isoform X2 [Manihot esculenta]|uniref:uncharacterized protein LOC110602184 isoform X2 n=1 Tax=Manihot esculenta TaxID=3983 RepID=UPI001CC491E8|nr:uncharacterized protein LOC110602184 isoform X2 [Manihot esculenta]